METFIRNQMNKRVQQAYIEELSRLAPHFTHALTLQTCLRTTNVKETQMKYLISRANKSIHYLRMRLNRTLYGNGPQRNPDLMPIFIPMLEGTPDNYNHNRSLHYHVMMGNLPNGCSTEMLTDAVTQIWISSDAGTKDIKVQEAYDTSSNRLTNYVVKEFKKFNTDVIDVYNMQIPHYLLT